MALTTERIQHLHSVRTLSRNGAPPTLESRFEVGQRVRVKSGALMGLEGVVISRRGEDRLLVGVQFLQQGAAVLIHDFRVEAF